LEQLPDLVRLGLARDGLQVQQLRESIVHEYVMAPSRAGQPEAERVCKPRDLVEAQVARSGERANPP
jgi:hypothetical protein